MKKRNFYVFIVVIIVLVTLTTLFFMESNRIIQVTRFPMDVTLTHNDIMGINADPGAFHFGSFKPGQHAGRKLEIKDIHEEVTVIISTKGEMGKWLTYDNNFPMREGDSKNISLTLITPSHASLGNYSGEVIIVLRKR
ncbi:hypothetical protein GOV09_05770 [Candidatus Woesearchaeota archaeon]|nr:hypothetical protein [Candidatus Woesearchaeota archaeon]